MNLNTALGDDTTSYSVIKTCRHALAILEAAAGNITKEDAEDFNDAYHRLSRIVESAPGMQAPAAPQCFRTVIITEVLSDAPYEPNSLTEVAHDITNGECSGDWDVIATDGISKREMALALSEQGSDPDFLLMDEGFAYNLEPGNAVIYGDETESRTIETIDFTDEIIHIRFEDGEEVDATAEELQAP